MKTFQKYCTSLFLLLILQLQSEAFEIDIWYGKDQSFGHLGGHPQRWINVLGHVDPADDLDSLSYRLNGGAWLPLSFLEDNKRIAKTGDFNVEILRSELNRGVNDVFISARNKHGSVATKMVHVIYYEPEGNWPLPYHIDWSQVNEISDAAQIVDGKWILTRDGVRSVEKYYDRVLAFGDASWENYEVRTTVIVHSLTPPKVDPNKTNVTHVAIATRWPGHDADGNQPTVKWHPLGATAEFRLGGDLSECRWRIFDGQREYHVESDRRRKIEFEKPYHMKHRVETLADSRTHYRVKLWPTDEKEPIDWDFERFEPGDLRSGSALLLAHHSEVTFGNVTVVPVD
jgi:hypothetical protein